MQIILDNIGILKHAEVNIGNITVICGKNNTGKTYATYTYYGFLNFFNHELINYINQIIDISKFDLASLENEGILIIDISQYIKTYKNILSKICDIYSQHLHEVFVSNRERFSDSKFNIVLDNDELNTSNSIKTKIADAYIIEKNTNEKQIIITRLTNKTKTPFPRTFFKSIIGHTIIRAIFQNLFPPSYFIASVERTGASIFKKELYLNRNRIVEQLSESSKKDKDIDFRDVLFNSYSPYPLPVKDNVAFIQELSLLEDNSQLSIQHPEILEEFCAIVGGVYNLNKEGEVNFIPNKIRGKKQTKLQLTESSSVVRALIHIDYYLHYKAKKGDILIVDEPELNLHPENQRKIARIFARLANAGISIFITTHSDYIVKELSTLIMLHQNTNEVEEVIKKYGYSNEEVLDSSSIRVYVADRKKIPINGRKSNSEHNILTPAPISEKYGIELKSFDYVINEMNEIQDYLSWS